MRVLISSTGLCVVSHRAAPTRSMLLKGPQKEVVFGPTGPLYQRAKADWVADMAASSSAKGSN